MHNRLYSLLVLRVFATFLVVFGHASSFFQAFLFTQWPQFVFIQNIAVVLFFCLSGYTIAWVCDQRQSGSAGGYSFSRFVFDRYMRLVIPLLPVLVLLAVVNLALYGARQPYAENFDLRTAVGNLLFLQRLELVLPVLGQVTQLGIDSFSTNRPLWTLGVEFWVYVLYAAFAFVSRSTLAAMGCVAIGLFAALLLNESLVGERGSGLPIVWMLGALLYHALKHHAGFTLRRSLVLLPAWGLVAALMFVPEIWQATGSYSHLYNLLIFANFAFFVMLFPLNGGESRPFDAVVNFLGNFAYTTYLVHYPVMAMLRAKRILPPESAWSVIIAVMLCYAVAYVVSLPFEQRYKPIRDWIWRTAVVPFKRA